MKLAINYSPPAAQLIKSGTVDIDYFKTPNWEWMVDEAKQIRPVAVHFMLDAGNGCLGQVDWGKIESLAQATGTPFINLHLITMSEYYPDISKETTDEADVKRLFTIMHSDVMRVVERFGEERIIIENSPFHGEAGNTLRPCVDPDLITQVIEKTGCGLLLDISHACIAAHYVNMDPQEYIARMPIKQLKELHFAGIHPVDGSLQDHQAISEADWHLLDWVFSKIQAGEWNKPWLLAFEYGGIGRAFEWRCDPEVIENQVPLLLERVKSLNRNLSG